MFSNPFPFTKISLIMPYNGNNEGKNLGQEKYPVCNLAILYMLHDEAEFSCHPLGLTIHTPHCFRL